MAKKIKDPKYISGFTKSLSQRMFFESKLFRNAIDRNRSVQQIVELDGEYQKKYEEFKKAYEEASKGLTAKERLSSRKTFQVDDQSYQIRTGTAIVNKKANFRAQKRVLNKLFPDLVGNYQLGHKNISVLRAYISLALETFEGDDSFSEKERKALLALFSITKEIDKIDKIAGSQSENKLLLIEKLKAIADTGPNIKADWQKDVNIIKGIEGKIELELEWEELNQFKGRLSAWVGTIFADIIKGSMDSFYKDLGDIDLTQLRGSRTLEEDIEEMLVSTIDPKKKYKSIPTKAGSEAKAKKKAPKKPRRKRLKQIRTRSVGTGTKQTESISPIALLTLINNKLPDTVAKNMILPRLQYRTGRFAESVRATDVQITKQGYPSIGYTYQKFPYQTFEPGFAQGDTDRDPRRLIDASIREIATKLVVGRLYTRRV